MIKKKINKILVANRGEIAVRIIDAIRKEGKFALAIYTDIDKNMSFVKMASESWSLGQGTLQDTYLNQKRIIEIAQNAKVDAIHPGYGFLSENSEFAKLCDEHDIVFIGPSSAVIELMGNKSSARDTVKKYNVPVIEGYSGNSEEIIRNIDSVVFPVLLKPAAGGGGKGMRIIYDKKSLSEAIVDVSIEANNYFGSAELYIEKYIARARHIEVQVLADLHGNAVHLYERECTLQRRYQKIIEEAPAVSISENLRDKITEAALLLVKSIGYTNTGTVEFLVDEDENFFFIEMNTRIQVEHPVTEMITGIDIVREQIRIAEGYPLSFKQSEIIVTGHSVEARIYAEDPFKDFMPSTGKIHALDVSKLFCRLDQGYQESDSISSFYDPMIAKIVSFGTDRFDAIHTLQKDLENFHLSGISSNREFLLCLLQSAAYSQNKIYTKFIDDEINSIIGDFQNRKKKIDNKLLLVIAALASLSYKYGKAPAHSIWSDIGHWRQIPYILIQLDGEQFKIPYQKSLSGRLFSFGFDDLSIEGSILEKNDNFYKLLVDGKQFQLWIDINISEITIDIEQFSFSLRRLDIPDYRYIGKRANEKTIESREIFAPLNGKIVKINVNEKDSIKNGDTLIIIESMKMENKIISNRDGMIENINVRKGELVELNKLLITLK